VVALCSQFCGAWAADTGGVKDPGGVSTGFLKAVGRDYRTRIAQQRLISNATRIELRATTFRAQCADSHATIMT